MHHSDRKLLLASIHDVGPRFEREVDRLAELFGRHLGGPDFAMLVVPDHWGESPLLPATPFAGRLRGWAEQGVEMFVHGWYHKDVARHAGLAGFKARHMTAGEGEFLGLGRAEAARRMDAGRKLVEDVTGKAAAGFVAPAWLYGEGALAALRSSDFALAEDHLRVWRPQSGETLARGPVITWASRSPVRTAASIAFAALARTALQPLDVVRVAAHPGDTSKPAILSSIGHTLESLAGHRRAARYAELLHSR
jgi:predicted deacetylase